jgi:hypothetical protein
MNILIAKDESHYGRLEKFNQPQAIIINVHYIDVLLE